MKTKPLYLNKMNKLYIIVGLLISSTSLNAELDQKQKYIPNEVMVFVTLKVNKNKSGPSENLVGGRADRKSI